MSASSAFDQPSALARSPNSTWAWRLGSGAPPNPLRCRFAFESASLRPRGAGDGRGAGRVSLDHEAIPDVERPAIVMALKAYPALLKNIKDGAGEIIAITAR